MNDNHGRKKTCGNKRQKPSYKDRQRISYEQGEDPPFLVQMKQKLGYKEYTVDDKVLIFFFLIKFSQFSDEDVHKEHSEDDEDDIRNVPVERRPQIIVLEPGKHLSNEQLQKEIDKKQEEEDSSLKIYF